MKRRTADDTGQEQRGRPFQPGQSGNPAGRPKGSRSKLAEAFLADMFDDWQEHGAASIVAMREKDPVAYVKVCASLLPKELKVSRAEEMSESERDERIRHLAGVLGLEISGLSTTQGGLEFFAGADAPEDETAPADGEAVH